MYPRAIEFLILFHIGATLLSPLGRRCCRLWGDVAVAPRTPGGATLTSPVTLTSPLSLTSPAKLRDGWRQVHPARHQQLVLGRFATVAEPQTTDQAALLQVGQDPGDAALGALRSSGQVATRWKHGLGHRVLALGQLHEHPEVRIRQIRDRPHPSSSLETHDEARWRASARRRAAVRREQSSQAASLLSRSPSAPGRSS